MKTLLSALALCALAAPAAAEDVTLFAAGSLSGAMTELAKSFTEHTGLTVATQFGPSGLLREKIEGGAKADLLASADLGHPRKLAADTRAFPTIRFTGNRLCGLGKAELGLTSANFLDKALDPAVRLGTSTPKADPAGDYTWALFAAAEKLRPGAEAALTAKALQLVGGPQSPKPPAGRGAITYMFETGAADMFIAYCTSAQAARKEGVPLTAVEIPPALAQTADYGLAVLADASPAGQRLAFFILSEPGQGILARWGFASISP